MFKSTRVRVAMRFLISAAVLAVLVRVVPLRSVGLALSHANVAFIFVGVVLSLVTRLVAAERTFAIGRKAGLCLSRAQTIEALFISNLWGLILPGVAAGSVATVYRYTQYGAPLLNSIGVLTVSRVVELAAFCALAGMGHAVALRTADLMTLALFSLALFACGVLVGGHWLAQRYRTAHTATTPRAGIMSRMLFSIRRLLIVIGAAPANVSTAAAFALLQGAFDAASVVALAASLGLHLEWYEALWINGLAYLAIILPVSVSGLGVRDAALITVLTPLGVASSTALALSMLMFALTLLNALIGGLLQLRSNAASPTVIESSHS